MRRHIAEIFTCFTFILRRSTLNKVQKMKRFLVELLLESLLESQESPLDRNMTDHLGAIPSSVAVPLGYHRDILELHLRVDL